MSSNPSTKSIVYPFGLAFFASMALGAPPARGFVIVDQFSNGNNVTSQMFADSPDFTSLGFDDFTLSQSAELGSLLIRGTESGNPAFNVSVTAAIWSAPDATGTPLYSFVGTQVNSDLVFNLSGATLLPGTYWISAQVTRPFSSGGQWFWNQSNSIAGAPAAWQNPGGGFGFGTSVIFAPNGPFTSSSFAFRLEGTPVPGPVPLLGAFAGFAASRRLRARIRSAKHSSTHDVT